MALFKSLSSDSYEAEIMTRGTRLRVELINTISKYTPFGPDELDAILESTKSVDMVLRSVEYALIFAVDLYTAREVLLGQEKK